MNITTESYGHAIMLNLDGDLTEDDLAGLLQVVNHQLLNEEVIDVVLNMENVPFLDSAALECLLDLQDRLSERFGQVKLAKVNENVGKILEMTRLDSSFETYRDISEAVKAVQA